MSTVERLLDDEDLAGMTAELKAWPNSTWGSDEQELGVSPFLTFYFLYDTDRSTETSLIMVDIHEAFEQLTGQSYLIGTHPDSERPHPYGSKRLPDLRDFARKAKKGDYFSFNVTSETNHRSSPATAGYFWKLRDYMNDRDDPNNKAYSSIQFYYRWAWFKENKGAWRNFVLQSIERLKPEVVYSGFAFANPLEHGTRAEVSVWERALSPRFYGLDIDFPFGMSHLGDGIRPPTWGFLLSDTWRSKLDMSREQVKDRLHHPDITIIELDTGLWIELGHEPSLFPVEDGVPELPKLLNRLIKPIRNDHTDLLGFAEWDGDPNERFNRMDSMRWLQRFDDDSDWPSIEQRRASRGAMVDPSAQLEIRELRGPENGKISNCERTREQKQEGKKELSTTTQMFDDEDLADMVSELKEWPNTGSGDDTQELAVSPFITFYFLYDTSQWVETSLLMVDIHEKFEQMMENPYLIGTHPTSERPHPYGSKRLPDLREFARKTKNGESFMFKVTNEKNSQSSPANAGYFWKKKDYMNDDPDPTNKVYSTIQFYYRWAWWKENKDAWRGFVLETIEKLSPEVVYNGFAMATPLEFGTRSAVTVWERALAPHFYGLDIDDPWAMDGQGDGIRPPTWGFLLSDTWRSKLGMSREQVRDQLYHPDITIIEIDAGLWIELGHEPSLFPVEEGVPELPRLLNRLIKPIRNDHTDLLGFAQCDGDPNERFNDADSMRWLQRFDDDSDWPSIEQRRSPFGSTGEPTLAAGGDELRAKAGGPCPKSGKWQ